MRYWIDFKKLREELSFAKILDQYQVQLRPRGEQAVGPCPLPRHEGDRKTDSFSANVPKGIFQCFSCHAKGNVLDFAVLMEGRDPQKGNDLRQTAIELAKRYELQHVGSEQKTRRQPENRENHRNGEQQNRATSTRGAPLVNQPLPFTLKDLDESHPHLSNHRKLTPETVKHFGLGFCSKGRLAGRIAIPIHDREGRLIAYAGRTIDDKTITPENPKYLFPGSREHQGVTYEFKKSLVLYNAHRVKAPVDDLIVVEGFASVWWLTQNGFPDCVALMGSSISDEQVKIALSLLLPTGRVTLVPDGDAAGKKFAEEAVEVIEGKNRLVRLPTDMQPTNLAGQELKQLLLSEDVPAGIGGGVSPNEDICQLINGFPCLTRFNIAPTTWDAEEFDRRALKFSSGEVSIAQFILGVWNPRITWQCGKFDLIEAAARLDREHRRIISDWFADPWWP